MLFRVVSWLNLIPFLTSNWPALSLVTARAVVFLVASQLLPAAAWRLLPDMLSRLSPSEHIRFEHRKEMNHAPQTKQRETKTATFVWLASCYFVWGAWFRLSFCPNLVIFDLTKSRVLRLRSSDVGRAPAIRNQCVVWFPLTRRGRSFGCSVAGVFRRGGGAAPASFA